MAAPQFQKSGYSTITLSKVIFPLRRPQTKVQVIERTAGGAIQVENLGVTLHTRVLPMARMTDAEVAALRTWHDTTANGAVNTFTFVDEDSTSHTVRWIDDTLDPPEVAPGGRHNAEITLEIVSTP